MVTHIYAACRNEERMIPHFLGHYDWVDRIFIFDDRSTDRSVELFSADPRVEVRELAITNPASKLGTLRTFTNTAWKQDRTPDWILVLNVDELIVHPTIPMPDYLDQCQRARMSCLPCVGFQMVSREFPEPGANLVETVTKGARFRPMDKAVTFSPRHLVEMRFSRGRHRAVPRGRLRFPAAPALQLRHFKYIGLDYASGRARQLADGLTDEDRRHANRYSPSDDGRRVEEFLRLEQAAGDLHGRPTTDGGLVPWWLTDPFWRPGPGGRVLRSRTGYRIGIRWARRHHPT